MYCIARAHFMDRHLHLDNELTMQQEEFRNTLIAGVLCKEKTTRRLSSLDPVWLMGVV
jgi:hypothetical protein